MQIVGWYRVKVYRQLVGKELKYEWLQYTGSWLV